MPGFIEAHGHLMSDGALGQLVWTGCEDRPRPDGTIARGCRTIEEVIDAPDGHTGRGRQSLLQPHLLLGRHSPYQDHGSDMARRMGAAATALSERIAISLHSDHPLTRVNPLFTVWCAVNRRTRSGVELGANERISAFESLAAVTLGSVYLLKRDEDLGSIEVGKFADFTVLARNPLTVEPMAIKDIAVVGTVVAGEPVTRSVR